MSKTVILSGITYPSAPRGGQIGVDVGGLRAADFPGIGPGIAIEVRLSAPYNGAEWAELLLAGADFVRAAGSGGEFGTFVVPFPGDFVRAEVREPRPKEYGQHRKVSAIIRDPARIAIRRQSRETVADILGIEPKEAPPPEPTPAPTKRRRRAV